MGIMEIMGIMGIMETINIPNIPNIPNITIKRRSGVIMGILSNYNLFISLVNVRYIGHSLHMIY
jgi:hypothetical protein